MFSLICLTYLAYFSYLNRHSLAGANSESEAFRTVGSALLESKLGKQEKYKVALSGVGRTRHV